MRSKKSFFLLLVTISSSLALTACDLSSLFNGFANKNNENSEESYLTYKPNGFSFKVKTDSYYPVYFRCTSYGDFDYSKKQFKQPDTYDVSRISDGSINPLCYTAYKANKLKELGVAPENFSPIEFDITYNEEFDYYPAPDCQLPNESNTIINSDAHYINTPNDNSYSCSASYIPAYDSIIEIFSSIPLPDAIARDERAYYQYALEMYTNVPQEYQSVIDGIITDNGWYSEELSQINSIGAYVSNMGALSMFNDDGSISISEYNSKSSDPVMDLINNQRGNDFDFNTVAVMILRRLNIPARMVKGYLVAGASKEETVVTEMNRHYYCEVYIRNTGWMIFDAMNMSNMTGTNPYGDLDQNSNPLENQHILEGITVTPPTKTQYYVGESLDIAGGSITAYFSDGTTSQISLSAGGVQITGFESDNPGVIDVTVSYTYEGVTKIDTFQVTIVARS